MTELAEPVEAQTHPILNFYILSRKNIKKIQKQPFSS